mgnify:CR=1 FL=1
MNEHAFKKKTSLDKDLKRIGILEQATQATGQQFVKIGLSVLFLVAVWVFASMQAGDIDNSAYIVAAGIIGGYMALNIGANDVANNVGPAVGSKALTMVGAIIIAAVFETSGAILAGGDVIKTIKKGIIDPSLMPNEQVFIWAMMAALLAAALWLNLATYVGAPVSTTHSIVGGVMGAGIAATGMAAVNWPTMGKIAASWVISPLMGGIIAALFLAFLQYTVMNQKDKIAAARRWVPVVVAVSPFSASVEVTETVSAKSTSLSAGGVIVRPAVSAAVSTKTPPPFSPARYGNRQILPRPTAEPEAAKINMSREDHIPCTDSDTAIFLPSYYRVGFILICLVLSAICNFASTHSLI